MAITFAVASLGEPLPDLENDDILQLLGAFPETEGKLIKGLTQFWNYENQEAGVQVLVVRILDENIHFEDSFPVVVIDPKIGLEDFSNPSVEFQPVLASYSAKLQEVLKFFMAKMVHLPGFDISKAEYHALVDGSTLVVLKGDTSAIYNELAETMRGSWALTSKRTS